MEAMNGERGPHSTLSIILHGSAYMITPGCKTALVEASAVHCHWCPVLATVGKSPACALLRQSEQGLRCAFHEYLHLVAGMRTQRRARPSCSRRASCTWAWACLVERRALAMVHFAALSAVLLSLCCVHVLAGIACCPGCRSFCCLPQILIPDACSIVQRLADCVSQCCRPLPHARRHARGIQAH